MNIKWSIIKKKKRQIDSKKLSLVRLFPPFWEADSNKYLMNLVISMKSCTLLQ